MTPDPPTLHLIHPHYTSSTHTTPHPPTRHLIHPHDTSSTHKTPHPPPTYMRCPTRRASVAGLELATFGSSEQTFSSSAQQRSVAQHHSMHSGSIAWQYCLQLCQLLSWQGSKFWGSELHELAARFRIVWAWWGSSLWLGDRPEKWWRCWLQTLQQKTQTKLGSSCILSFECPLKCMIHLGL